MLRQRRGIDKETLIDHMGSHLTASQLANMKKRISIRTQLWNFHVTFQHKTKNKSVYSHKDYRRIFIPASTP